MATHSSVLAWRIPWTEKPGRLQSMGSHSVGHDWSDLAAVRVVRRRQWQPTPVLLPGKSHGRRSLESCSSPWGCWGSDTTERLHFRFSLSCIAEGNGNPPQCSCLENPRDGGAWWAAVYGVAQSRTRLKRLSSSSEGSLLLAKILTDTIKNSQYIKDSLHKGHLMRWASSLEKTLRLGKTEGRRRGRQRMGWLDGITDSTDTRLSKLLETAKDREAQRASVHGVTKSWTQLSNWKQHKGL